jgi:enoyl-CoA hydratase/carnithine racemase
MFEFFDFKVSNGVALVTVNRPPVNAMSREVYESLERLINHVEASPEIRSLVLAGSDQCRAWIGGADLNEFLTLTPETRTARHAYVESVTDKFYNISRPTIAAITKPAVGGGMVIASFCDIRVAADTAFFGMPEVDRSLTGGAGAYFNRLNMPAGFIREMIFTGRRFTAAQVEKVGFLNHVVPEDQVLAKALEIAEVIATKSLPAVQAIKRGANIVDATGWDEGRAAAHRESALLVGTADYKEGINAFLERRKPNYKHG